MKSFLTSFFIFLILLFVFPVGDAIGQEKCFGKKVDRVIKANNITAYSKYRETVYIVGDNVTLKAKPETTVCADQGEQIVFAGKGRPQVSTGRGNDKIYLSDASSKSIVLAGSGNDQVYGSRGPDTIWGSDQKEFSATDNDKIISHGGNDRVYDYAGKNIIYTKNGIDKVWSLKKSESDIFAGNGSDYIYSNGGEGQGFERLYGERGNDRLLADTEPSSGRAFLDPGPGDDWVRGTSKDDVILFQSGIKKINALDGNDLVLLTSKGAATIYGGLGVDTVSLALHTPPGYWQLEGGVLVDLANNQLYGHNRLGIDSFENVIGSSFADRIIGKSGVNNQISSGLGDDSLYGNRNDQDFLDGGLGVNFCRDYFQDQNCNASSPGNFADDNVLTEIDQSGVLTVFAKDGDDDLNVSYNKATSNYKIKSTQTAIPSGLCQKIDLDIVCPAQASNLNGLLLYSGKGDDRVEIDQSVPNTLTTNLDGGSGVNQIIGGNSKDTILTELNNSAGSTLFGRAGVDNIYINDDLLVSGGEGTDVLHAKYPCIGGQVSGGPERDNLVFAGASSGVWASLGEGLARYREGNCLKPLIIDKTVEGLEGSAHNDHLIIGQKFSSQDGPGQLLGREGIDILDSRNGDKDTVTTGSGGKNNQVIADKIDKIIWGWGASGY